MSLMTASTTTGARSNTSTTTVSLRRQRRKRRTTTVSRAMMNLRFDDDDGKKNSNDEEKTMSKRQFALSTAAAVASVVLSLGQPMDAQALSLKSSNKNGVYWIEPKNNATVTSPFTAKFGVKGYEVVPASAEFEEGTGHHHIIVDGEYMEKGTVVPFDATHLHYGKAQKEGEITLEPGTHTLTLQFANGKHVSYGKKFASTITVNVDVVLGKMVSGAQKRKKKREKEKLAAEMERLKLGPTKLWTGLVLHHKDIFVSHVLPKLNTTDRCFFGMVNRETEDMIEYARVNVSELVPGVHECTSISTLEWMWNHMPLGKKDDEGDVIDQAYFCEQVARTNKLEFLKWAREVKQCEWDEWTITVAAFKANLEMLKYCFSNECPCDEEEACEQAAAGGHLDCLRFLVDKVDPSRDTEKEAAVQAACGGHVDILKYLVEERKTSEEHKCVCVYYACTYGRLDCLKYLFGEEAKAPLDNWGYVACARYYEHTDCVNYLLEKGCPEPTDEEYDLFVKDRKEQH
ncbi:unnamed protein product [Bathycoccus prasinos]